MYLSFAKVISLILFAVYYYSVTKNRLLLYILSNIAFIILCSLLFKLIYPSIPLHSPTIEYIGFLVIVGITTLAMIILIAKEVENKKSIRNDGNRDIGAVFKLNKKNVIFWSGIFLLDLIAYLMDR